jgi:Fe-S cluster biogenesis protein NfuA
MDEELKNKIEKVIAEKIDLQLGEHLGGAEISGFEDGILSIRFTGSCATCYAASDTFNDFVREVLMKEVPEIRDVVLDESVSEDILDFARGLLGGDKG